MRCALIVLLFIVFVLSQNCQIEGPFACSGGVFNGLDFGADEEDDSFEYFASFGDTTTSESCTIIQQGEYVIDDDNQIFVTIDDDSDDDCAIIGDAPELCSCIPTSIEFSLSSDCLTVTGPNGETCVAVDDCEDSLTCPGGLAPIDNPDVEPTANGCGPGFFPLTGPSFSFRHCCEEHDFCYGTCGASKVQCDSQFYGCMACSCDAEYDNDFFSEILCKEVACSYYQAVDEFGCIAFSGSQERACICPGEKARTIDNIPSKFGPNFVPPSNSTKNGAAIQKLICTAPFDPECDNYSTVVSLESMSQSPVSLVSPESPVSPASPFSPLSSSPDSSTSNSPFSTQSPSSTDSSSSNNGNSNENSGAAIRFPISFLFFIFAVLII